MSQPQTPRKLPQGKRILSGIQSTGPAHLGNYFGALRQYVTLQDGNDGRYFIADYHSMTSVHDPVARRRYTPAIALDFLALGLAPARALLSRPSGCSSAHTPTRTRRPRAPRSRRGCSCTRC